MPVTRDELAEFNQFVLDQMERDGANESLEDCIRQWRRRQRQAEDLIAIKQGLAEADAGLCRPLEEVDREIRRQLGIPPVS